MADNITYANTGTGAIPNSTQIRSRQNSNGQHIQVVDVAPFQASAVAGTVRDTAVGHALQAGDMIEVENLSNFKMISTTGTSTVQVSYHRYV